tara:strand:- start:686 stop:862 length:177 start_codon:yes stop_codon:yes gene_type:complete
MVKRKSPKKKVKKVKRKMNEYFKKMLAAKKSGAKSFTYKGNTYKQTKTKTGLTTYKRA